MQIGTTSFYLLYISVKTAVTFLDKILIKTFGAKVTIY